MCSTHSNQLLKLVDDDYVIVSSHVLDTLFIYLFSPVLMTDSLMTYQRHQDIEKKWTDELKIHCH
ncbi:hypothetical protein DERP_009252 [Dermatophagoides pteronyssinus]|uniref:Uncharacterized protein n=1 Tax=Dermatophagoides pteronyssinus TaxID=6956 RepID=A0ABQ8JR63_DERPT|nr:hypothetical protein DERP_009252 [Dermatophagoides pteronyssinus]